MWTQFLDLSSGGNKKTEWSVIVIEMPETDARAYFTERFGLNPDNITCECCGEDFAVREYASLDEARGGCYGSVLVITKSEATA